MISRIKPTYLLLTLLTISFVVHLIFYIWHPGFYAEFGTRDAGKYYEMALRLIQDGTYGYHKAVDAYVTPSQPFYLAGLILIADMIHIDHVAFIRFFTMLLSVATVGLLFYVAYLSFGKWRYSVITALLYMSYFTPYHRFRNLLTEVPSVFFFTLGILLVLLAFKKRQWRYHVAFGIIASIAIMFRPVIAPLLLIPIITVIVRYPVKRALAIGICWLVGPLLIMVPWVVRNYLQFGHAYLFSSHGGNPMLAGTNPYFLKDFAEIAEKGRELGLSQEEYALKRMWGGFTTQFNLYFSWFTVGKTIEMFKKPDTIEVYKDTFSSGMITWIYLQHYFLVIGGFISAVVWRKQPMVMKFGLVVLLYIALSNIYLTIPRFALLAIPLLSLCFAYGIGQVGEYLARRKNKKIAD